MEENGHLLARLVTSDTVPGATFPAFLRRPDIRTAAADLILIMVAPSYLVT